MAKTSTHPPLDLDEVWKDDLLGRRAEAELLASYIECVAARPALRDDLQSFTIAVDTEYGEGKTFFLRRLANHLSAKHPVAFVNAWADDVSDEPLTAIAATLKNALDPLLKDDKHLAKKFASVVDVTGKVAKIAVVGAAKRALGLLITSAAVAAADEVIAAVGEGAQPLAAEASGSGEKIVAGVEKAIKSVAPNKFMNERIADFRRGQEALAELKVALNSLISALDEKEKHAPIVVIVDELDRCRPTYAIKLLEEVKHLFDVPGLVFVFGMHGDQLAHSVKAAYGADFNGKAYLSRFIGRRYRLRTPNLSPLVEHLLKASGIPEAKMRFLRLASGSRAPHEAIASFMRLYGAPARDAYQLIDLLQTSAALTGNEALWMDYLLPLAIARIRPPKDGELPTPVSTVPLWSYRVQNYQGQGTEISVLDLVNKVHRYMKTSEREMRKNVDTADPIVQLAYEMRTHSIERLADPSVYCDLLDAVGRFSGPQRLNES